MATHHDQDLPFRHYGASASAPVDESLAPPEISQPAALPDGKWRRRWKWIRRGLKAFALLVILLITWLALTAPLSKSLEPIAPAEITLLASDGTPIARNGAIVEDPVTIATLPAHVPAAFIAIEDHRFYSHWGIDPRGIARALWTNLTTGRTQGGSTITQQLAKFTFLTPEQNITRKAREAMIALWLEAWLTKDEILERYLSNAYFGDNSYGLRAASLHYFNRQPERLTPAQAAMLAGLVKAPSRLAPTRDYAAAEARMRLVLDAMAREGYLSADDIQTMRAPRLDVRTQSDLPTGTYFADWALPQARSLNEAGYTRRTITTTLDSRLQAIARRSVARAGLTNAQIALVAMRPNGEVVAMIGGKDYAASPFNRATQAKRQPGSTFKLFVYLAALRNGWEPDDRIGNTAFETGSYRPRNAAGTYSESLTLEEAFARSSNVAAVRLFSEVGDTAVIKAARDLGVTAPLPKGDPSLALGTSTMTLLELTAAYAGIAANAYPVLPHAFAEEEKGWLESLFSGPKRLSGSVHEGMQRLLRSAVNRGTGRAAMLSGPNYGKTGTSQDNRDALFVGYAGDLVVGVWVGNDDNSPLAGVNGGNVPARIWRDFMVQAQSKGQRKPEQDAPDPTGPVQPQDILDTDAIPLGESARLHFEDGQPVITADVDGEPVTVRLDGAQVPEIGQKLADELKRRMAAERDAMDGADNSEQ